MIIVTFLLSCYPVIHISTGVRMSTENLWKQIKNSLKLKNSNNSLVQMWFEPTEIISIDEDSGGSRFKLSVPSELHKYWITQNLLDSIFLEISAIYGKPFQIEFVVNEVSPKSPNASTDASMLALSQPPVSLTGTLGHTPTAKNKDTLNYDYTFSTFVVGRNNEFAHAASFSISENPGGNNYNPLFICGPTGMGKTHLLNAVGNHIKEKCPHFRVNYMSAERFLNECISSIRRREMDKFRKKFRQDCDVLLMDDIQFLGRGEAVQEEFFHTLNDFFEKKHQVVVASDRMPKDINGLEDRIRTRLEWGLIADIQMPDIETRVAILKYKAERKRLNINQEVITYIARISKRSIRELEGNLNKVKMFSELQGLNITLDLAKKVLATHDDTTSMTIAEIQKLVADHFKVKVADLKSKSRTKPLVVGRQVAMYLVKKHLDKSLVDIGRAFGGKDHSTVINALRRVESQLAINSDLKSDLEELETRIHNITGL